jgi:Sulfotransferase domain
MEFRAAPSQQPDDQSTLAGLATVTQQTDPAEAASLWRRAIGATPAAAPLRWRISYARALADSGDPEEAYALLIRTLNEEEEKAAPFEACALMTRLLIDLDLRDDAATQLSSGVLRSAGHNKFIPRIHLQYWLGRRADARATFAEALQSARLVSRLRALARWVPRLFDHYERETTWRLLRERVLGLPDQSDPEVALLCLRLDFALGDYASFLERLRSAPALPEPWPKGLRCVAEKLSAARYPDFNAPKVFGIGLSRTGTSSLGAALERLGYLQAHFLNPFTMEILSERDFGLFDAATDTPVSMRFETLFNLYPNARFVLTERPYDSWAGSLRRHFEHWIGTADFACLRELTARQGASIHPPELAMVHGALYYSHPDPRAAYDTFHTRVTRFFADKPDGKLLRHSVFLGDGWRKLCEFLGRPVPEEPYPRINQAAGRGTTGGRRLSRR